MTRFAANDFRALMRRAVSVHGLFALAAAAAVLWLHVRFLVVLPDPLLYPDSLDYAAAPLAWLSGLDFAVAPHRPVGYSLWIALWLVVGKSFRSVLIAQHLIALATSAVAGWFAVRFLKTSKMAGILIFFFVGTMPRMLVMSHCLLTETLFSFLFLSTLFLLAKAARSESPWAWAPAWATLWMALLVRPVARALVAGAAVALGTTPAVARRRAMGTVVILLALVLGTSAVNRWSRGFWGFERFSGLSLFGPAAHLVSPDSLAEPLKTRWAPIYAAHPEELRDENWARFDPQGPVSALNGLVDEPGERDRLLWRLAWKAIASHPGNYLWQQARDLWGFFWERSARPGQLFPKGHAAVASMQRYGLLVMRYPIAASFVTYPPKDVAGYRAKIDAQPLYPFEQPGATRLLWALAAGLRWVGLAAILMSVVLATRSESRPVLSIVWSAALAHMLVTTMAGDHDPRHALALEPLFVLLTMAGADALLRRLLTERASR